MSGILWLASYPKSGNTWLRVFLANLREGADTPVDINTLQTTQFSARELWDHAIGWETSELTTSEVATLRLPVQEQLARTAPGIPIKTHEVFADPQDGLPRFSRPATRGVLYVVRHPLDLAVSLAHHRGESLDAAIAFMNDPRAAVSFGPGEPHFTQLLCDWSTHVQSWADAAGMPVCVLRYEDMLATPRESFRRAAAAAGFETDGARIDRAVANTDFEILRRQERDKGFQESAAGRPFFREGRSGGWRQKLTSRQVAAVVDRHGAMMKRFGYLDGTQML